MTTLEAPPQPALSRRERSNTAELVGVSFPDRTIELVVIPYDVETDVPHPTKMNGPRVSEVISRGAFDGVERRPNRIKANREHEEKLTFGKAVALHPSRDHGLVAEIRVAPTALGTETLELADMGCLDASAQFEVKRGDWRWETSDRYRVGKAFLRHIALVSDGAYGENASVLSVRQNVPAVGEPRATPVLAGFEMRLLLEEEARINARWAR
jgi:HK97 family phage prohead protease